MRNIQELKAEISTLIPDYFFLKMSYKRVFGKKLDLKNPQSFNEKLQWLKLHDRKPEYTMMVDKYEVKNYVAEKIGSQYLIPTYGVWDRFDDIIFDELPNQFVLKCTHDSGSVAICKDKSQFNFQDAKRKLTDSLKKNYYYSGREWPYKNVPRRIICEKYIVDESEELKDYKVLCFNGEPKLIELHMGRFTNHQSQDFYDTDWEKISITQGRCSNYVGTNTVVPKPSNLEKMLELSRILAQGIPHVRVDWYSINGQLFFGELTFFDGSGFVAFDNQEDDLMLGSWIDLPENDVT